MNSRLFILLVSITALLGLFYIGYVAYLRFSPVRVLEPRVQPYVVISKTVEAGKPILYQVDACKYLDAPATVYRQMVSKSGLIIALQSSVSYITNGCTKSLVTSSPTPANTPPGDYFLEIRLTYQLNGGRTVTVRVITQTFTIIAPSEQKGSL